MVHNNANNDNQAILRQAIDSAMQSLGKPIHKTLTWYLDSRGVFSDPKKFDVNFFYSNLQELLGPGADLIMEETWDQLRKENGNNALHDHARSPLERIQKMMEIGGM